MGVDIRGGEHPGVPSEDVIAREELGGDLIDIYTVIPPFASVAIYIENPETEGGGRRKYRPLEPVLNSSERDLVEEIKNILLEDKRIVPPPYFSGFEEGFNFYARLTSYVLREYGLYGRFYTILQEYVNKIYRSWFEQIETKPLYGGRKKALRQTYRQLGRQLLNKIVYYVYRDLGGMGPLEVLYRDPRVEDIVIDGYDLPVHLYHQRYEWLVTDIRFEREELDRLIHSLALKIRRPLNVAQPIAEGPIPPEGYRCHLTLGVVSLRGPSVTIRKYSERPFTVVDLIRFGTLDSRIVGYIWLALDYTSSMLVVGPMGSGKTTLLNAIAMLIRPDAKIVTIEETPELRLPQDNWVPMATRPSYEEGVSDIDLFELLKSSLRQRPDYIIVGEIRGEEAYTFFQAIAVGHGGLATVHSDTVENLVRRLMTEPMNVPRSLIPLVKIFILTGILRGEEGIPKRRVIVIKESVGLDPNTGTVVLNTLADYDPRKDNWSINKRSRLLEEIAKRTGIDVADLVTEWENRATYIEYIYRLAAEKGEIIDYRRLASLLRAYHIDPHKEYMRAESYVGGAVRIQG